MRERGKEGRDIADGGSGKPHPPPAPREQLQKATKRGGGGGGMPVHYVVLPALLLGALAVVVYFGEVLWAGPGVNRPLPLPPAVSDVWRNDSVYLTRLWGTYR